MFDSLTPRVWQLLGQATLETVYMVFVAGFVATLLGVPLGIALFTSRKGQIRANATVYNVLNAIVNIGRSVPFIILLVAIIPFTRWILGTSIGTSAANSTCYCRVIH